MILKKKKSDFYISHREQKTDFWSLCTARAPNLARHPMKSDATNLDFFPQRRSKVWKKVPFGNTNKYEKKAENSITYMLKQKWFDNSHSKLYLSRILIPSNSLAVKRFQTSTYQRIQFTRIWSAACARFRPANNIASTVKYGCDIHRNQAVLHLKKGNPKVGLFIFPWAPKTQCSRAC